MLCFQVCIVQLLKLYSSSNVHGEYLGQGLGLNSPELGINAQPDNRAGDGAASLIEAPADSLVTLSSLVVGAASFIEEPPDFRFTLRRPVVDTDGGGGRL